MIPLYLCWCGLVKLFSIAIWRSFFPWYYLLFLQHSVHNVFWRLRPTFPKMGFRQPECFKVFKRYRLSFPCYRPSSHWLETWINNLWYERSASMAFGASTLSFGDGLSWNQLLPITNTAGRSHKVPLNITKTEEIMRFDSTPIPFEGWNGRPVLRASAVAS